MTYMGICEPTTHSSLSPVSLVHYLHLQQLLQHVLDGDYADRLNISCAWAGGVV